MANTFYLLQKIFIYFNTSLDTQKSCILEIWPVSSYWTLVGNICGIGTVHSDRTWVQLIGGQVTDGTHVSSGAGQAPVTGVSPLPVVVGQDWAGVGVPGITSQTVGAGVAGDGGGTPGTESSSRTVPTLAGTHSSCLVNEFLWGAGLGCGGTWLLNDMKIILRTNRNFKIWDKRKLTWINVQV